MTKEENSPFLIASAITLTFFIYRFIELKFIKKEPLKRLFHDTFIVYGCSVVGIFVLNQIHPLTQALHNAPNVFLNDPDF